MNSTLWYNGRIVTPEGILPDSGILVGAEGTITAVGGTELACGLDESVRRCDLQGLLVLPGLIDVHVHGGGGFNMMSGTREALDGMGRFHAENGTTSFLATTESASAHDICAALRNVREAIGNGASGAELLGIHLEGPFLNVKRAGAQNKAHLTAPEPAMIEQFLDAAGGCIRLVTMAPELAGGLAGVLRFIQAGITVSAGHTDATFAEMEEAIKHGVTHTTHHFNGMRPLHHREPGVVGAGLLLPELTIELIADGIHVHPEVIRMAFLTKPASRICMITDAVSCAGLPDGDYGEVIMEKGEIYLKDLSTLAGSSLTMIRALQNTLRFTGLSLLQLLPAFTLVPARQIGVADRKGTIEQGKDADFIVVDDRYELYRTIVRGREVVNKRTAPA